MSYKYKAYNQLTGAYPSLKIIESNEFFDITWEKQETYNGTLYLFYERRHFMPFEKNQWVYLLYLTEVEKSVLGEAFNLGKNCTKESVRKTLNRYPFITELLYSDKSRDSYESSYVSYVDDYLHILVHANEISDKDRQDALFKLFSMFEGIKKECCNFSYSLEYLELTDWAKQEIEWKLERQKNPQIATSEYKKRSKIEKYLKTAGVLGLKFIAKSVGADLNINIPIDIPDIDGDIDIDIDTDFDLGGDIADIDIGSEISFQGNPLTANSDGFIPKGTEQLERKINESTDTFKLLSKAGNDNNVGDISELTSGINLSGEDIEDLSGDDVVVDSNPNNSLPIGALEDTYNVSFQGNKTIGNDLYLDKGEKYFKCAGGATGGDDITVYVKSGTNSRYVFNGSTPICIDGKRLVTINGRTYLVP